MSPSRSNGSRVSGGATGARRYAGRRSCPFRFDRSILAEKAPGGTVVAGADEVGRGCLAGPLVAVALTLDYRQDLATLLAGLSDSKALTLAAREALYPRLLLAAHRIVLVVVSPRRIDEVGLHRSNLLALAQSLEGLRGAYDLALVDGFELSRPDLRSIALTDGDWRSAAIAAASVVAKVSRDRLMRGLDPLHPQYGFCDHVGYGTRRHREAVAAHGPCPLHRLSFAPFADAASCVQSAEASLRNEL